MGRKAKVTDKSIKIDRDFVIGFTFRDRDWYFYKVGKRTSFKPIDDVYLNPTYKLVKLPKKKVDEVAAKFSNLDVSGYEVDVRPIPYLHLIQEGYVKDKKELKSLLEMRRK